MMNKRNKGKKRRFSITLLRIDSGEPFDRKVVEVEARHMDTAVKRAEKMASVGNQEWRHIRVRELPQTQPSVEEVNNG